MGRPKEHKDKFMLESMRKKYKKNDIEQVVYKLSFAGKFIIVKGKTLYGSLLIIGDTFDYFTLNKNKYKKHLYIRLYNHYIKHRHMRFTVRVLAKKDRKTGQFDLLKREQMELDKYFNKPECLNNTKDAYVPQFQPVSRKYGWMEPSEVRRFKRWLKSAQRASYIKRFCI